MFRSVLRSGALTLLLFCLAEPTLAQQQVYVASACNYGSRSSPSSITAYPAPERARQVVSRILSHTHHEKNFSIRAGNVPNAAAILTASGRRLLVYNSTFMRNQVRETGTRWAVVGILAHEVGHHLGKHNLSNRTISAELEADRFSGYILKKLGASAKEAYRYISETGDDLGGLGPASHPGRRQRLEAVARGGVMAGEGKSPLRHDLERQAQKNTDRRRLNGQKRVTLGVTNLKLARAKRNGQRWDAGLPGTRGPYPDPYVEIFKGRRRVCISGVEKNNFEPHVSLSCTFSAQGSTIIGIRVWDWDGTLGGGHDPVGVWTGTINELLQQGSQISFRSVNGLTFSINW